ncbi:MAG TPA: MCP four helix bundle domain-containing protein, partial [Candidatus Kapabacteria bacterium]|nr:MCP four helix bundle domain-containing protein [Candidatus Kapabacteria bacterium]
MKIGAKLQLGFAVGTVLICIIAVMGLNTARELNESLNDLALHWYPTAVHAIKNNTEISAKLIALEMAIKSKDPDLVREEFIVIENGYKAIQASVDTLKARINSEQGKELLSKFYKARDEYLVEEAATIKQLQENLKNGVNNTNINTEKLNALRLPYLKATKDIEEYENAQFTKVATQTNIEYNTAFTLILTLAIIAVLLSISIAFFTT